MNLNHFNNSYLYGYLKVLNLLGIIKIKTLDIKVSKHHQKKKYFS